jgi:hypothetical protein
MRAVVLQRCRAFSRGARLAMKRRMAFRPCSILDSLFDLRADSREPDVFRLRRAHLAKYTKAALAGAIGICVLAGLRTAASAAFSDDDAALGAQASLAGVKATELLATAPNGAKLTSGIAVAKLRSRSR